MELEESLEEDIVRMQELEVITGINEAVARDQNTLWDRAGKMCRCKGQCASNQCGCKARGELCTPACKCVDCVNRVQLLPGTV